MEGKREDGQAGVGGTTCCLLADDKAKMLFVRARPGLPQRVRVQGSEKAEKWQEAQAACGITGK